MANKNEGFVMSPLYLIAKCKSNVKQKIMCYENDGGYPSFQAGDSPDSAPCRAPVAIKKGELSADKLPQRTAGRRAGWWLAIPLLLRAIAGYAPGALARNWRGGLSATLAGTAGPPDHTLSICLRGAKP